MYVLHATATNHLDRTYTCILDKCTFTNCYAREFVCPRLLLHIHQILLSSFVSSFQGYIQRSFIRQSLSEIITPFTLGSIPFMQAFLIISAYQFSLHFGNILDNESVRRLIYFFKQVNQFKNLIYNIHEGLLATYEIIIIVSMVKIHCLFTQPIFKSYIKIYHKTESIPIWFQLIYYLC